MIVITDKDLEKARNEIPDKIHELEELLGYVSNWVQEDCCNKTSIEIKNKKKDTKMKEVYALMADEDGTTWSHAWPFGFAVTTEEEAKRYIKEGGVGYTHSYCKLVIFDDKDEAIRHYKSQ